ncbi:MAG: hypothetical protein HKO66_05795 [Saprospiraceae bacterium]|nr:hypothetical protein [Saprospiraceae bacterium]
MALLALSPFLIRFYLKRQSYRTDSKIFNDKRELRLPRLHLILGIILLLLPIIFLIGYYFDPQMKFAVFFILLFFTFGIFGGLLISIYLNHKLSFDDDAFTITDWKGSLERIHWKEIESIKNKSHSDNIQIYTTNKQVKISKHIIGLQLFINKLEEKCEIFLY